MGKSHEQVIRGFKDGKSYSGCSVFARGNTLYSYGMHFPLAVRKDNGIYLLNGDKYSVSTSKHQNITYRVFPDSPRVSFSACRRACNDVSYWFNYATIIDYTKDSYGSADKDFEEFKKTIPIGAEVHISKNDYGKIEHMSYHRIGQVLFEYENRYFICGMDEGSYFVSELPNKVNSVKDAFLLLMPKLARDAITQGIEVKRQGEWFFIPPKDSMISVPKHKVKDELKMQALPFEQNSAQHTVTRMILNGKMIFAKGFVRHSRHEHRTLKLGDDFHIAMKNTAIGNWSSNGNVD